MSKSRMGKKTAYLILLLTSPIWFPAIGAFWLLELITDAMNEVQP